MKQLTFEQIRQLLLILIGGVVITVFTHHHFHHDRYEYLGSSRVSLDKMTGKVYNSDLFIIDKFE